MGRIVATLRSWLDRFLIAVYGDQQGHGAHRVPIEPIASRAWAPHCDPSILHAPGTCEYCDEYPDWQRYRERARIGFTDEEPALERAPCPSEWFRTGTARDRWPGNLPKPYRGADDAAR